ncbi:hypothetical protein [Fodinicola feengrottensis]|uniref:hypothetical protein n=1 Tax=Fodinicola feengrottensis TaxID=435914 RepID=UPI0013D4780A|nr:hypothetical protein [Fodinicola feengrottensis]
MTTRAAPFKTAASEGVQPASITAFVGAIVFSVVLVVVVLGLGAAQVGLYSWDSVGGAKPSPNQLTTMAWLVMLSASVGGLAANRLARRVFRLSAPGPIWFSTVGVAVGAVPAAIWLVVHAAQTRPGWLRRRRPPLGGFWRCCRRPWSECWWSRSGRICG